MTLFISRFVILGTIVFYILLCVLYRPFVADDAFIVGRYALNAAAGNGLVYNVGERVLALTSPLHGLLEAGLAHFSNDPVTLYRLIAPAFPILGLLAAFRIYRPAPFEQAYVSVFALASPFLAIWTVGGLETPMLAAFLTLFAAYVVKIARMGEASNADLVYLGVLAAIAFLTRYDSLLITGPIMASVLLVCWRRPMVWIAGGLSAAIASSWLVFAYIYYGDIFPTSAYIKLFDPSDAFASRVTTLNAMIVTGAFLAIAGPLLTRRQLRDTQMAREIRRGGLVAAVSFLIYAASKSGVHMMFSYRMFVPVLFPFAMVAAAYLQRGGRLVLLLQSGVQVTVAILVMTVGLNVHAVRNFGPLGIVEPEYLNAPPHEYGTFMATLRADGADLSAHWAAQDQNRPARIFVYTGGMGYWLKDFYVFESLVSYRLGCRADIIQVLLASDYVQDMNVAANNAIQSSYRAGFDRPNDFETVSASEFFMYKPWSISYNYAPARISLELTKRVGDPCESVD